jgi:gliding motility-associated protein GldE
MLIFNINFLQIYFKAFAIPNVIAIISMLVLLILSALISGSEVAFFSLSPTNINAIKKKKKKTNQIIQKLLSIPERLLATILIANNFVNIGIIIISTLLIVYEKSSEMSSLAIIDFSDNPTVGYVFQIFIITFLILLFGEIIPKVYATQYALHFASFMAYPLFLLEKVFRPISSILVYSTAIVNKKFSKRKQNVSIDDLSKALDITSNAFIEDKKILTGIVKFGNIDAIEIMKPRVDVISIDLKTSFNKLMAVIIDSGYSRIPVYSETFDNIKGILYTKDLLPHFHKKDNFHWQTLIRAPYFVPETKKINDLLEEFQTKKIHLAIVVDEYGGFNGIVTLEDILEEIVGEISDEFDEDENYYTKIDDNNYIFEGKTLLNDFYKIIQSQDNVFNEIKGEADTLAGLILEIKKEIPQKGDTISYKQFTFTIKSVDKRRIKQIKVTFT